jgi:signal transduction histidine kinase
MGRDLAPPVSTAGLTAASLAAAYIDAVVPAGLDPSGEARARDDATAFLGMLLRHVQGDAAALGEIEAMLSAVAAGVVREGDDPGVLLDRFDSGRHVILAALLAAGCQSAEVAAADDRLRVAMRTVRTAIRDALAEYEATIKRAVGEVTAAIERNAPPDEVMQLAAEKLCRLVECDRARLWLDIGGGRLELVATAGSSSPMGFFVSSDRGVIADILRAGRPVRRCPVDPKEWEAAVPNLPIPGSALFLPLASSGHAVGLVYALRNDAVAFSDAAERIGARFVELVEPSLAWAMQVRSLQRWTSASQDFLRITTHELRRPLTILRGYLDMLDSVKAEDAVVLRERMSRAADQLAELLTGITDTVTLEDPARALTVRRTTLDELVEAVMRTARDEAEQQGVDLLVEVQEGETEVLCDVDNIAHALANLLSNAFRHTGGDRRVWLEARPEGSRFVRFQVRDEGEGITPGDEGRIFTKYFRSDATRRAGSPGSGLGLYYVRLVAERHGGRVAADNIPGNGACFTLELPLEPGLVAWSI